MWNFQKLPGSAPDPAGGLTAPPPPQTPSWRRAVVRTACLASQDLPSFASFFSHSSYFGRTSFFFVATALFTGCPARVCCGRQIRFERHFTRYGNSLISDCTKLDFVWKLSSQAFQKYACCPTKYESLSTYEAICDLARFFFSQKVADKLLNFGE